MDAFTSVVHTLSDLYPERADIKRLAEQSQLEVKHATLQGSALDMWYAALNEARKQHRVDELLEVVKEEYPGHIDNVEFEMIVGSRSEEVKILTTTIGLLIIAGICVIGYIVIVLVK